MRAGARGGIPYLNRAVKGTRPRPRRRWAMRWPAQCWSCWRRAAATPPGTARAWRWRSWRAAGCCRPPACSARRRGSPTRCVLTRGAARTGALPARPPGPLPARARPRALVRHAHGTLRTNLCKRCRACIGPHRVFRRDRQPSVVHVLHHARALLTNLTLLLEAVCRLPAAAPTSSAFMPAEAVLGV